MVQVSEDVFALQSFLRGIDEWWTCHIYEAAKHAYKLCCKTCGHILNTGFHTPPKRKKYRNPLVAASNQKIMSAVWNASRQAWFVNEVSLISIWIICVLYDWTMETVVIPVLICSFLLAEGWRVMGWLLADRECTSRRRCFCRWFGLLNIQGSYRSTITLTETFAHALPTFQFVHMEK